MDWQEIVKTFSIAYGYGYYEILSIPLDEIYELLPDAKMVCDQKLAYLGIKEL